MSLLPLTNLLTCYLIKYVMFDAPIASHLQLMQADLDNYQ
jgi:hypothetical protein